MRNSAKPLEQLYGRLPFAVQAKLYNHQALTDEEQVRHQAVLTAIAAAEERQHQATLAIFAKYCTMTTSAMLAVSLAPGSQHPKIPISIRSRLLSGISDVPNASTLAQSKQMR